jgi:hypothetical protein
MIRFGILQRLLCLLVFNIDSEVINIEKRAKEPPQKKMKHTHPQGYPAMSSGVGGSGILDQNYICIRFI